MKKKSYSSNVFDELNVFGCMFAVAWVAVIALVWVMFRLSRFF